MDSECVCEPHCPACLGLTEPGEAALGQLPLDTAGHVARLEEELAAAHEARRLSEAARAEAEQRVRSLEERIRARQDLDAAAALRVGDVPPGEHVVSFLAREVVQLRRIVAEPGRIDTVAVEEILASVHTHLVEPDGSLWLRGTGPVCLLTRPLPVWLAEIARRSTAAIEFVRAARAPKNPPTSPAGVRSPHPAGSPSPSN